MGKEFFGMLRLAGGAKQSFLGEFFVRQLSYGVLVADGKQGIKGFSGRRSFLSFFYLDH